jgi:hypothetical protein
MPPDPQGTPQLPQLFTSDEVSTHWLPQIVWSEAQPVVPPLPFPAAPPFPFPAAPLAPPLPGVGGKVAPQADASTAKLSPRNHLHDPFIRPAGSIS